MKHFLCMQIFHRLLLTELDRFPRAANRKQRNLPSSFVTSHAHPLAEWSIIQSVSRTRRLARPRGGGPDSGLGSGSGTGADRPFRIVKSETMKRVDHKR